MPLETKEPLPFKKPDLNQPKNGLPRTRIPYPPDCGATVIKAGDVIMTRALYDFLIISLSVLPNLPADEQRVICEQISIDLKGLLR